MEVFVIGGLMKVYSGKKYGNKIADFLKINRGLFHTAMEEGGCEMHLLKLYFLKQEGLGMAEVAYDSCEYLLRGLLVLETRFGKQPLSEDAFEKIKAFRLAHEKSTSSSDASMSEAYQKDGDHDLIRGSGRYQLKYKVELVQKLRGKEFISEEVSGLRSDDLEGLKSMAFMHKLAGKKVELKDLATGKVIEAD